MQYYNMPMSFSMALAQQPKAIEQFKNLPDSEKDNIINQACNIKSKKEMWSFVSSLAQG